MKECPSCKTSVADNVDTCTACGWQFAVGVGNGGTAIVRPATRPRIPCEAQIAITVDRTGSSDKFSLGIPLTLAGILNPVAAKAREVTVWLQTHGDIDEHEDMVLLTDGGNVAQALTDIKTVVYNGGGDPAESHLDAIEHLVATVPWKADPRKARGAILGLMTADTKKAKSGKTAKEIGQEIKDKGLLIYCVCEPTATLQELTDAAGGLMFQISNTPDPAELQKVASAISASIVASIARGATLPMNAPTNTAGSNVI